MSSEKPVTLAMTYAHNDEDEVDAVERVLARAENYPFEFTHGIVSRVKLENEAFEL